jgi:YVTN family beta-propeller protein
MAGMPGMAHGAASSTMPGQSPDCLTTYVSVSPDDRRLYLACNHSNELQVRDAGTLALVARVPTGAGAYNVEPSPDGRWVLVTNKKGQSVSVVDAATLKEVARVATSKPVPHGIAFSPDGRWAFVTCESVGTDPGAVDAIDLASRTRAASMPIPLQPTGIALLPR